MREFNASIYLMTWLSFSPVTANTTYESWRALWFGFWPCLPYEGCRSQKGLPRRPCTTSRAVATKTQYQFLEFRKPLLITIRSVLTVSEVVRTWEMYWFPGKLQCTFVSD